MSRLISSSMRLRAEGLKAMVVSCSVVMGWCWIQGSGEVCATGRGEDLSGVVGTTIRGKEGYGLSDFLGFREPLEWLQGQQRLDVIIAGLVQHRGVDARWCQRINPDVEGGELAG